MGWRFRKSFKILPGIRMNFGKKGFSSFTFGKGWFSTNVSSKGTHQNFNIPGTGITYRTQTTPHTQQALVPTVVEMARTNWYCPFCRQGNIATNNFCGNCGAAYQSQSTAVYQPNALARSPWKPVFGVALLLTVVIGICSLCSPSSTPVSNSSTAPKQAPAALYTTPAPTPAPTLDYSRLKNTKKKKTAVSPLVVTTPAVTTRSTSVYGSGAYITGPRGGCYYINSHGNKTYVDHSHCN
jgi:hypothetical protein